MKPQIILAAGLGLALALAPASGPALAQDADIMALNQQSDAAWQAGRVEEALQAGEAAWRTAEEEWGPVENTALLAYGFTNIALMAGRDEAALESSTRLLELVEAGAAPSIPLTDAELLNALADARIDGPRRREINRLEDALIAAEDAGMQPNYVLWSGWLDVARAQFDGRDFDEAYEAGDYVLNLMNLTGDVPDDARIEAAMLAGQSATALRDLTRAYEAFAPALDLVDKYVERDGALRLNPEWAELAVYTFSTRTAILSTRQDIPLPPDDVFGIGGDAIVTPEHATCHLQWLERQPGIYPSAALRRNMIGVVIVEFEVDAEGHTQNVEVAAANSEEYFGPSAVDAVETWTADPATLDGCVGERLASMMNYQLAR